MKIKIKKLHPDAVVPQYATVGSSGFDLVAVEDTFIGPGETKLVKTGLSVAIPEGYELQVRPRSGYSLKTDLMVANAPGTVDADYRGEVCVILKNVNQHKHEGAAISYISYPIKKGDRIAQGVIQKVEKVSFEVVEELDETSRGSGGFGSSGT